MNINSIIIISAHWSDIFLAASFLIVFIVFFYLFSFLYSILSLFHKTRHQCGQKRKNFIAQRNLFLPWYDNKLFDSCIIACAYWRFHTEPEKHFCATASQYLMLLNHLCLLGVNTGSTCTGWPQARLSEGGQKWAQGLKKRAQSKKLHS